jgi:hypothetical protein
MLTQLLNPAGHLYWPGPGFKLTFHNDFAKHYDVLITNRNFAFTSDGDAQAG